MFSSVPIATCDIPGGSATPVAPFGSAHALQIISTRQWEVENRLIPSIPVEYYAQ